MVSAILSRVVILVFGTLYPAYASYKAVKTKNVKEYVKWMMYWIVFAFFTCAETFSDIFLVWLPFYYEIKMLFVLWLLSPATKGSSILYRKFVHPQLARREKDIDTYINKVSDQGYTAIMSLGSKGINYATNVVLSTAIKGQSTIVEHIKKSYSMNDISPRGLEKEASVEDETDNRLLEESYNQELLEDRGNISQDDEEYRPRHRTLSSGLEKIGEESTEKYLDNRDFDTREENEDIENREVRTSGRTRYSHKESSVSKKDILPRQLSDTSSDRHSRGTGTYTRRSFIPSTSSYTSSSPSWKRHSYY